ncbi:SDR family oxidoreductase [Bradyrhizobium sp.]|jgi:3-oxoacyl-[acyl-carrier protein] reductase|uniref:SDR family NAD(P)-dependent oxidoreductase n=1 Tax=Bradyrhizobium sp. TaxID=376 RepID=UPI002DF9774A|nr:SDR family oxidoreductase [Bradyrhizobium sp.]
MALTDDQWVVISGAGGALGSALASHFASRGRRVLGLDRTFDGAAPAPGVMASTVDLLVEAEVRQALADIIQANEGIALLVNAVGLIWNEPVLALRGTKFATHSLETWRKVTDANLTAPFVVATQVAARMVRRGGGSIVNFSSIASRGNAGQAAYGAAKAGIEGLTRTMAVELGPLGVRVNAVALGFIDVPTTRTAVAEERLQAYARNTPLGRLGRVEDVIGAIEFLAANAFANGTIVKLDGGLRL